MSEYGYHRSGIYRSRNGMIAGVWSGLAEHFDFSALWVRVIVVALFFCTGFWPIGALYIVAAFMMKKEPYVRWEG